MPRHFVEDIASANTNTSLEDSNSAVSTELFPESEREIGSKKNCLTFSSDIDSLHSPFCPSLQSKSLREILSPIIVVDPTVAPHSNFSPLKTPRKCNCEPIRRYASRIQNATADEMGIIDLVLLLGWNNAEEIAPKMGFKSNRPLRRLLELESK